MRARPADVRRLIVLLDQLPLLLVSARQRRGWSMMEVARKIGTSAQVIHKLEHQLGGITVTTAIRLLGWLATEEDDANDAINNDDDDENEE
jgi:ribosome-binding protein aMBF1 (putative translation factor)